VHMGSTHGYHFRRLLQGRTGQWTPLGGPSLRLRLPSRFLVVTTRDLQGLVPKRPGTSSKTSQDVPPLGAWCGCVPKPLPSATGARRISVGPQGAYPLRASRRDEGSRPTASIGVESSLSRQGAHERRRARTILLRAKDASRDCARQPGSG
jgi:hypothetical protein